MIVISKHTNQLCNRLFTYLPVLSYALEADEPVCFLFQYSKYDEFFPNLKKEGYISYLNDKSLSPSLTSKLLNGLVRLLDNVVHLILRPSEKIPLVKPLGYLFNPKWKEIRYDKAYIMKHADRLRYLFSPSPEVLNEINKMLVRDENTTYVGVHMRGGDYRTYLDGKYFYEPQIYLAYMRQMSEQLSSGGNKVRFLLCTNEDINMSVFDEYEVVRLNGSDMLIDLYGLSQCDYIIGPPSTFSQWASFYGKTPLRVLYTSDENILLYDFKTVVALDTFE